MRTAGILFPVSSLPSPYGIGNFGHKAYEFVDFLVKAKQTYWQILPLGPTGYGDSPYQSFSAFALNPYFIDLDTLAGQNLLTHEEINSFYFGDKADSIDYNSLFLNRKPLLSKAVARFSQGDWAFIEYKKNNAHWLPDYALFMALKAAHGMVSYTLWEEALRTRDAESIENAKEQHRDEIIFWETIQFFAHTQWTTLKRYANERGIKIIGDIPIYVSPDSSDLWANNKLFQTDKEGRPTEVAGVPPDAFSADGQLWGNPLYDWDAHFNQGFAWWIKRLQHAKELYDVVRIDHFRGFAGYYAVPFGDETAKNGRWRMGPGISIIHAMQEADMQIIAEDLGYLTYDVIELLRQSGFPGMKVLQFAFDSREESDYLPHNYPKNTVVFTGTHDNTTTEDWQYSAPPADVLFAKEYLNIKEEDDFPLAFIRSCFASVADTAIIPIADWLTLGKEARINTPSTTQGNWLWRAQDGVINDELAEKIARLTKVYGR